MTDEEKDGAPEERKSEPVLKAGEVPPIDFNTFVLSLSTSALVHLGVAKGPGGEAPTPELPLARHTIDLLSLLEEKTAGNLTGEEERLLAQVLYDLKMRYLAACQD
jgi:hypothetical protein